MPHWLWAAPRAPLSVFGVLTRGVAVTADGVGRRAAAIVVVKLLALAVVVRGVHELARALGQGRVVRALEARVALLVVHDRATVVHPALRRVLAGEVGVARGAGSRRADDRESEESTHCCLLEWQSALEGVRSRLRSSENESGPITN